MMPCGAIIVAFPQYKTGGLLYCPGIILMNQRRAAKTNILARSFSLESVFDGHDSFHLLNSRGGVLSGIPIACIQTSPYSNPSYYFDLQTKSILQYFTSAGQLPMARISGGLRVMTGRIIRSNLAV